jgi:hypothetical protein
MTLNMNCVVQFVFYFALLGAFFVTILKADIEVCALRRDESFQLSHFNTEEKWGFVPSNNP